MRRATLGRESGNERMSTPIYASAQDAEDAFYKALERGDYDAMVSVWADDEEVICVHPGAPRLRGVAEVLAGWKRILGNGQRLRVKVAQQSTITAMTVAVHSVHELISIEGEGPAKHPVVATNVYQRTSRGWRMIVHHASPAPGPAEPAPAPPDPSPKILH